jgi:Lon protease-like protein
MHEYELPPGCTETCRLFPLPGLVFFPHAVLPLHIFETRYRQMTEDALATDNLITMIQLKSDRKDQRRDEPRPIEDVGCLGKIIRYERLNDGRFNLLLVGLRRVKIRAELPSKKLYRIAAAEILEDLPLDGPESPSRSRLIQLFRSRLGEERGIDPDLRKLLDSDTIALGALTDIIAHTLEIPSNLKQILLAESSVDRRVSLLLTALGGSTNVEPSSFARTFPPPFSLN